MIVKNFTDTNQDIKNLELKIILFLKKGQISS